jgi:hypothetical protein
MFHTVYLSFETQTVGRDYVGKHSTENPYDDYLGSFKDQTFNPQGKMILEYSRTEEGAIMAEMRWQKVLNVVEDPSFANRSLQTSTKFSYSAKGENHPMFGVESPNLNKTWWVKGTEETMSVECPGPGWVRGRLKETNQKISQTLVGRFEGENHPLSKLTNTQRSEIKRRAKLGFGGNVMELSREFGVTGRQIRNIVNPPKRKSLHGPSSPC